jgi:hypothetical protein
MGVAKKTRKFGAVSNPSQPASSFKADTPPGQENNRAKRRTPQEEPSQGRNRVKKEGKRRRDSARSVHLPPNLQFLQLMIWRRPQVSSALFFQVCLSQYCSAISSSMGVGAKRISQETEWASVSNLAPWTLSFLLYIRNSHTNWMIVQYRSRPTIQCPDRHEFFESLRAEEITIAGDVDVCLPPTSPIHSPPLHLPSICNHADQDDRDTLYAKCIPIITSCVMAELEKLGPK